MQPRLNCNSTLLLLYSQPPKPLPLSPPSTCSTRSKVKRSGSCKVVLPLFLAATIHAGVFFFTRKFFTMAPALVRATGRAPPRKPNRTTSHESTACIGICGPCTNHGKQAAAHPAVFSVALALVLDMLKPQPLVACVQTVLPPAATVDGQMSVESFVKRAGCSGTAWLCMARKFSVAAVSTR